MSPQFTRLVFLDDRLHNNPSLSPWLPFTARKYQSKFVKLSLFHCRSGIVLFISLSLAMIECLTVPGIRLCNLWNWSSRFQLPYFSTVDRGVKSIIGPYRVSSFFFGFCFRLISSLVIYVAAPEAQFLSQRELERKWEKNEWWTEHNNV